MKPTDYGDIDTVGGGRCGAEREDGAFLLEIEGPEFEEAMTTLPELTRIVTAVNVHDELVAALECATAIIEGELPESPALDRFRAAIARARGETNE